MLVSLQLSTVRLVPLRRTLPLCEPKPVPWTVTVRLVAPTATSMERTIGFWALGVGLGTLGVGPGTGTGVPTLLPVPPGRGVGVGAGVGAGAGAGVAAPIVSEPALVAPAGVWTSTGPLVAPEGTVKLMMVSYQNAT